MGTRNRMSVARCCCGGCDCAAGTLPNTWAMTAANIKNGTCASCTTYNGSFLTGFVTHDATSCYWDYHFPSKPCGYAGTSDYWRIRVLGSGVYEARLSIGEVFFFYWRGTSLIGNDCRVSGLVLSYAGADPADADICVGTGLPASTVTITANAPFA